jgi:hypothetical protein
MFFFEKKNQKTFDTCCVLPARRAPTGKSFLLLFFKKEGLPFFGQGGLRSRLRARSGGQAARGPD